MYHHVSAHIERGPWARALTVSPAEFEGQLAWLRLHGCRAATVETLTRYIDRVRRLHGCEVALTFDDGYADAATVALPLLRRHGVRATFFVTSGYVGQPGHLSGAHLVRLAKAGMEIGGHTVSHPDLTLLSRRRMIQEVQQPRSTLREESGAQVTDFAYPAGRFNAAVEKQVRNAGYRHALGTSPGVLSAALLEHRPFELPRYRVLRGQGIALFSAVLGSAAQAAALSDARGVREARNVVRKRIEGNDRATAEKVGLALLTGGFAEQVLKVRVFAIGPAHVAGIMLSGVKFHRRRDAAQFSADVRRMAQSAFRAAPILSEVDAWAVVPSPTAAGADVSGDYAVPTTRTVFSWATLTSAGGKVPRMANGKTFWDAGWREGLNGRR